MGAALVLGLGAAGAAGPAVPTITTVAGDGVLGYSGDGGAATAAEINHPRSIAWAPDGGFVFADAFGQAVRRVWPNGTITTVAGTGQAGFSGDGGPATQAELDLPHGVAYTTNGTLLIVDALNNRVRAVAPDGTITTAVGTGVRGYAGDGGPATEAELNTPRGIAALPDGGYLIADSDNNRIRRVDANGTITTVAGGAGHGFAGDGGPATQAELARPFGVAPTFDGGFLIVDAENNRIRKVAADGTITTVAGNGVRGYAGDGGPATLAEINGPHNVAALPDGGFLIADALDNRVRRVWPDGSITTIAGTGDAGYSGDGGPAAQAELNEPKALLVLPNYQGFLVADALNSRIRLVTVDLRRLVTLTAPKGPLRTGRRHAVTLAYTVNDAVTAHLVVRRAGRGVVAFAEAAKVGRNAFRFGRGLRAGRYQLTLTVSSALDQPAQAILTLVVS